jgi:hypothetical protein
MEVIDIVVPHFDTIQSLQGWFIHRTIFNMAGNPGDVDLEDYYNMAKRIYHHRGVLAHIKQDLGDVGYGVVQD